jgi:hypothetical protein
MAEPGKFAKYLLVHQLVSQADLDRALKLQTSFPFLKIGEVLVQMGVLRFENLVRALKEYRSQCRVGEILILDGKLVRWQLDRALQHQKETGLILGKCIIDLGYCTLEEVMDALAIQKHSYASVV